jgi:outer membrane protein assembly factor BamB
MFMISTDQQLAAISLDDGGVAWVTQLPRFDDPEKRRDPLRWLGPLAVGDRLVLAGTNKTALAINPYNGKIIGSQELRGAASVAPAMADGTLYLVTDDATLTAFR